MDGELKKLYETEDDDGIPEVGCLLCSRMVYARH